MVQWLVEGFPIQFLNDLLEQTVELRRDPEEREEEFQRQEAKRWLDEHQNETLIFQGDNGQQEVINITDFAWVD